jgi:hypothetical protein
MHTPKVLQRIALPLSFRLWCFRPFSGKNRKKIRDVFHAVRWPQIARGQPTGDRFRQRLPENPVCAKRRVFATQSATTRIAFSFG